jgi:hypothetical protein
MELGAIAVAILAVIVVVAVLVNRGGGKDKRPDRPAAPPPRTSAPTPVPPPPVPAGESFEALAQTLRSGKSCQARRAAVAPLRELGDKRAVPLLKRAAGARSGWFGTGHPNSCLEREAGEAAKYLQGLP